MTNFFQCCVTSYSSCAIPVTGTKVNESVVDNEVMMCHITIAVEVLIFCHKYMDKTNPAGNQ